MIDVIAPFREGDEVLRRSRWIAELNAARLRWQGHTVRTVPTFEPTPEGRGFAFFGHGNEEYLQDAQESNLVPPSATSALHGRWFHAFACKGRAFGDAYEVRCDSPDYLHFWVDPVSVCSDPVTLTGVLERPDTW